MTQAVDSMRIAVPRGALFERTLDLLDALDLETGEMRSDSRKLLFEDIGRQINGAVRISAVTVRPSDVPAYVEYGAADLGIAGKDVLMEQREREIYEVIDLRYGRCSIVIAAPRGSKLPVDTKDWLGVVRVATKYPNTTARYFEGSGLQVEIIKLRGSVELAPSAGLADAIVDIAETGETLKANEMEVCETVAQCSARLVANSVSYKTKYELVDGIAGKAAAWAAMEQADEGR